MFPCIFFFKNGISSISFPAQFQDVFPEFAIFPECFFQYWFFNVYFSRAVFCQFFPARDYKFFPVCFFPELVFSRCYIFCPVLYFANFFLHLGFSRMFFPELQYFFLNLLLTFFSRMFFPELYFANFIVHPALISFFQNSCFQNCILQFFSCTFCLPFFPGCFFPNCNFAILFPRLVLISFFQNVFSRIVFCQFFPAPSNASIFRKVFSRIGVSLCSIFFQNCILPFFPALFDFQFFPLCFFPKRCSKNT